MSPQVQYGLYRITLTILSSPVAEPIDMLTPPTPNTEYDDNEAPLTSNELADEPVPSTTDNEPTLLTEYDDTETPEMSVALTSNELADEQASSTTDEPTLLTEYEDNEIQEILTSDTEYNSQDTKSSTRSTSDTEDNETVPNPSSNTNSHHFRKIFEGSNISVCAA